MMKRRTMRSAILCLLMLAVVCCGLIGLGTLSVGAAAGDVSYVERSWNGTQVVDTQRTLAAGSYTEVAAGSTAWGTADTTTWYVVNSNVAIAERITVTGDVRLVLVDGTTLTASLGVHIAGGNSLTVYGQSADTGKLLAAVATDGDERLNAAIGGNYKGAFGTLAVHGGNVEGSLSVVTSTNSSGAGIGGGYDGGGGSITVYGGTVKGTVDDYTFGGAGIGSGGSGDACTVTVYGGYVEGANYKDDSGAGIGAGHYGAQGDISIHGGTVVGTAQMYAAGIGCASNGTGGTITITGGTVTGTAGELGAGIGGGRNASPTLIHISGGTVTGTSADGAGVGFGYQAEGGTLMISGGTVSGTATASGAGIGTGSIATGCILTITGGTVTGSNTASSFKGADIGGGYFENMETLTVYGDATLTGTVDNYNAGLVQSGNTVTVTGNYTLPFDLTIDEGTTLVISEGATLTVPEGKTLTNNGALTVEGSVVNNGTATCGSTGAHGYREACVVNCALCGEARADAADHTYDTTCDTTCNVCGDVRVDVTDHEYSEIGICACGVYEPAVEVDYENCASLGLTDAYLGYYAVGNYGQFLWIRDHINSGNSATNFVLTADIDFSPLTNDDPWVPITDFGGTFDGGFHRIKNLYLSEYGVKSTLFWRSQTSTYRNVIIDSSCYFKGVTAPLVSIIAEDSGSESYIATLTFENCGNEANVDGGSYSAGLALINSVNVNGSFINCYNAGNVSGKRTHGAYGFTSSNHMRFYNCYNSGTIIISDEENSSRAYPFSDGDASYQNNCHDYKTNPDGFASGEVAYLLSQGVIVSEVFYSGAIWGQDLTTGEGDTHTDAAPVFNGARVYSCNGYSNANEHVFNQYNFDDDTHWMECSCGEKSGDAAVAHDHGLAKYDDTNHWNECECGHQTGVTLHVTGDWAYDGEQHWKPCSGCAIDTISRGTHEHAEEWTTDAESAYHLCECGHKADVRALSYGITFDKNGGTGELENTTFTYDAETKFEYTVPACELTYVNHSFEGWLVSMGGNELGIKQAGEKLDVSGELVLTAQWSVDYAFDTLPTAKEGLIYNGSEQVLLNAGTLNSAALEDGGVVWYWLGGEDGWISSIPTATDAITYTVYYYVDVDGVYYCEGSVEITIARKQVVPVIEDLQDPCYVPGLSAENPAKPSFSVTVDGERIDSRHYDSHFANNTANGTATLTVTARESGNYAFDPISADFTVVDHEHSWEYSVDETHKNIGYATCVSDDGGVCIEDRRVTLTLSAPDVTYDGEAHPATLEVSDDSFVAHWVFVYKRNEDILYDAPVEAGKYTAFLGFDSEHMISVEFEISPIGLTLEWSDTELTYNGLEQVPTATVTEGVLEGDTVTVTVSGAQKNAGTDYFATASLDNSNYTITNSSESFRINPATLTLEWSNLSFVYDGEEHLPTAVISGGILGGDSVSVTVGLDITGFAISTGDYPVRATIDNENYILTNATQTFTITPLELETPTIESVQYTAELQTADVPLSDYYNVLTNEGGIDVGEYDVVLMLASPHVVWKDSDEDTLTLKFVIEKMVLDPSTFQEFETEYTGEAQMPEVSADAPFELMTEEGFTDAGEYTVTLKLIDTVNYEWVDPDAEDSTLTTATFEIKKASNGWLCHPVIGMWQMGEAPSFSVSEAMFGNETLVVTYDTNSDPLDGTLEAPPMNAGNYVAYFTIAGTDNYDGLTHVVEFAVLPPNVSIGGWALFEGHYMDTNGIISETQPEGGYAYLREDGVLVLNNFELDATVFSAIERTEENERFFVYDLYTEEEASLIKCLVDDMTILLVGTNELTGCGANIGAIVGDLMNASRLTLRGEILATDGAIGASEVTIEGCIVLAGAMLVRESFVATDSLIDAHQILVYGDLRVNDCTLKVDNEILVLRDATIESSTVDCGGMVCTNRNDVFGKLTIRNSHVKVDSENIGIVAYVLEAEDSCFDLSVSEFFAIAADTLLMTRCDVTIGGSKFGMMLVEAELTDCTVKVDRASAFTQKTETTPSKLILNDCEIEALTVEDGMPLIDMGTVVVNGGKLKLTSLGSGAMIVGNNFGALDAEIELVYCDYGMQVDIIELVNSKLTVTQSEYATKLGTAVIAFNVGIMDSTVTIKGGEIGILASADLKLYDSSLEIVLGVPAELSVPEGEEEPPVPAYMGIRASTLGTFGEGTVLTVTIPEDASGRVLQCENVSSDDNITITAPEGAYIDTVPAEGEDGSYLFVVVDEGESLVHPRSVTISYVEPEEIPEEPGEEEVVVGGVLLENGKYLDNNGNLSDEKPEGGYAHLADGVLTLHDFTYYGIGYLYETYYDEVSDLTYESYAGIYSTRGLTLRLEGKNLIDLETFAGGRNIRGMLIEGDLAIEGDGELKLLSINDGIEVWGALTARDVKVEMKSGSEGFDVYGTALFENCELILDVEDDGIWTEDDLTLVDCRVEILSMDDGLRSVKNIRVFDCVLDINTDEDGIDADEGLTMIGCEGVIVAGSNGIEVELDIEITDCVLQVTAGNNGIHSNGGRTVSLADSTLVIDAGNDGVEVERGGLSVKRCALTVNVTEDALFAESEVTVEDSGLSLAASSYGIFLSEVTDPLILRNAITLRNSRVTVISGHGLEGPYVIASDSELNVNVLENVICAGSILLENCKGNLKSSSAAVIYGYSAEMIGCEMTLCGSGAIAVQNDVRLSDCKLCFEYRVDYDAIPLSLAPPMILVSPMILASNLVIEGDDTEIECRNTHYLYDAWENGDLYIDGDLCFWDAYENNFAEFDPENGRVYSYDEYADWFVIIHPSKLLIEDEDENQNEPTLVIGGVELGVGEYLDNEGNVTSEMPAGGFAYFSGSELILKSFVYEGVGTTLTSRNGEAITAGIYCDGALKLRLMGDSSLKFTSESTVGIALGEGDLRVLGDGSLVLETTSTGIALYGSLFVENVALTVEAIDLGITAGEISFVDAAVTVNVTGEGELQGICVIGDLCMTGSELTVNTETSDPENSQAHAIYCLNGDISLDDSTATLTVKGLNGIHLSRGDLILTDSKMTLLVDASIGMFLLMGDLILTDSTLDVTVGGMGSFGIYLAQGDMTLVDSTVISSDSGNAISLTYGALTVKDSVLQVSVNTENEGGAAVGISASRFTAEGSKTRIEVMLDGNGSVLLVEEEATISEELAILIPEGGSLVKLSNGSWGVSDGMTESVRSLTVAVSQVSAEKIDSVTIGGVLLADGEYLDNDGNVTTEKPEGGYAYLKDGVLTLNNFEYLTKKYDSCEGIYATKDLTLVLIGENLLNTYTQNAIRTEGDLSVIGDGSLTLETAAMGMLVKGALTVDCNSLTVRAGELAVQASEASFLGGEVKLSAAKGENVLISEKAIVLGELITAVTPVGASVQKLDGRYVFTDAEGKPVTALTLSWAAHDCIDEDAVDHLCDICGKDYPTCKDADLDHACDACGKEVGYHADTNADHVCEYGCGVSIGTCEDADTDHDCDYGCDKVFGTCADEDQDHECDYGCDKVFGTCADGDRNHKCDYGCGRDFGTCEDADTDHDCDYGCDKVFGICADEDQDHECDYGCDKVFGTCADADRNHKCDYGCGRDFGTCEDADTDHDCDYGCDKVFGTCADEDQDHECDYGCDKVFGTCADGDRNHKCDYGCGRDFGTCEDADTDHDCDYGCDKAYGEHTALNGSHVCAYCEDEVSDCADADGNHICDVCADELPHSYSNAWSGDANLHWHECSCGAKKDVTIHEPGSAATETQPQICTVCEQILTPATGHVTHVAGAAWSSNATHHWHVCTGCSEQMEKSEHRYDNDCDTTCNDCGAARGITHSYGATLKYDADGHWYECSICEHKKDEAEHVPGAEATETVAQTCTVCGYVITPATGHTTHTAKTDWVSNSTHHWHECTGCNEQMEKAEHQYDNDCDTDCNGCGKIRTVTHDYQSEWSKNDAKHWHACDICGNQKGEADHSLSAWTVTKPATATEKGSKSASCVCGYTVEEEIPALGVVEETRGEQETADAGNTPTPDPDQTPAEEDGGLSTGAVVAIVIGSTVVAGAGGFAIWWFAISKRSFAQLGSACKGIFEKTKRLFTRK